ncbi:hypothetical protein Metal_0883 [Methylomicrobium album BG8]|uniref:Uncharacterized protein n=1 Tax=Methylomicrobium album BG8 TaxID=686340 RepID=H8GFV6_METAL|nr:hypothetical protein Metal_0883 [Methylomicrobium album BG8]
MSVDRPVWRRIAWRHPPYGAIDREPNNQENRKVKDGLPKASPGKPGEAFLFGYPDLCVLSVSELAAVILA